MHVRLNMAASLDGHVAMPGGTPVRLSSPEDHARVHRLRATSDAVLVGVGTVLTDDPRLSARTEPPPARQPLRVVVDPGLRTPADARGLDGTAPSLLLVGCEAPPRHGKAEVVRIGTGRPTPNEVLDALATRGVERLLVEGGPTLAGAFLAAGVIDDLSLYIAPRVLGDGVALWPALAAAGVTLRQRSVTPMGEGLVVHYEVA